MASQFVENFQMQVVQPDLKRLFWIAHGGVYSTPVANVNNVIDVVQIIRYKLGVPTQW